MPEDLPKLIVEIDAEEDCGSGYVHVYPTFGRAHVTEGSACWCEPTSDRECHMVLIHHPEH
jgi:hypothetical protein